MKARDQLIERYKAFVNDLNGSQFKTWDQYRDLAFAHRVTSLPRWVLHVSGIYDENFDVFVKGITWDQYLEVIRNYRQGIYKPNRIQEAVKELEEANERTRERIANLKNELKSILNP